MADKDKVYISALLHDIGKFIERQKNTEWQNDAKKYLHTKEASKEYAHRRYSALFIEKYLNNKQFVNNNANAILDLVLHHHNDNPKEVENYLSIDQRGVLQKIIRIADDLASSERQKDEQLKPVDYFLANLESPFNDINFERISNSELERNKAYIETTSIHTEREGHFPVKKETAEENLYPKLVNSFLAEIENIETEDGLLSLMEKHLSHVPAQSPKKINNQDYLYKADINLFDHSRTAAAIAVCLFEEYLNGAYKGKEREICSNDYKNNLTTKPAMLICGNVNGIQDFIFNVKSKRAAKSLKGRSYFIQILSKVISKYIVEQFELKEANILYNGGGNFFILAPNYRKNSINKLQTEIAEVLKETNLYLSLGFTEVDFNEFEKFGNVFDRAVKRTNVSKKQKFKDLQKENIFEPFPQKLKGESKYDQLAEDLQLANSIYIGLDNNENSNRSEWEKIFRKLNYQVTLRTSPFEKQGVLFNQTNFSETHESFHFAVKDLPKWNKSNKKQFGEDFDFEEGESIGSIIPWKRFARLAEIDTGTEKLGVLKMDIDNLGKIFKDGIENPTIGRVAFLSRTLQWFFEGYVNTLLQSEKYRDRIYPIFSGGDDFFVVGAWNSIFEFAIMMRNEFKEFVSAHPGITLSASLLIVDEKYPITQIARLAEERLEDAKNRRGYKSNKKVKNAVSVFDTVLSWNDFIEAEKLKNKIKNVIELNNNNRAIINKIQKSSVGFAAIQKDALFNGKIKNHKVWRFNYYLRDLSNVSSKNLNKAEIEKIVEEIIKQYENLFFKAFKGEETSIQMFPVAARWAELETRKLIGDK
ncbi:MAG: type III-A CRISPR-associated protein Cas10/Csm1 [Ignavibacteriae bacterium]|nr:type III-A CRISPR-associated protein Cas10/Csm1 [Ignavibacteriota bacterium]NOH00228.1 type III-A CRISPR-associated protein Cas10/Csm1 [Ignavibacteriota bacterium]